MLKDSGLEKLNIRVEAGGDASVGAITTNNHHNYFFVGFGPDDHIDEIVRNVEVSNEIRKLLNCNFTQRDGYFLRGAFRQALRNEAVYVQPEEFKLINKQFSAGLSHGKFNNDLGLKQAFANCSQLVSLEQRREICCDADRRRWSVDAGLANQIANRSYNDCSLKAIRTTPGINDGTLAIMESIEYYISGDNVNIQDNTTRLLLAFNCSDSEYSRALILNRLIVNANLLSDFSIVENYIDKIDFDDIQDTNLTAKILDAYATLTFNRLSDKEFPCFEGADLTKIIDAWNTRGVIVGDADLDKEYIERFGLHIFTIQQMRYFHTCASLDRSADNFSSFRNLRAQMIENFLKSIDLAEKLPEHHNIAKDFFGSLQRPAFHALLCRDFDHLTEIMNIYFGRNGYGISSALDNARTEVLKTKGLNRQWMTLLDITSKISYRKEEAILQFEQFVKDYLITSKKPLARNHVILNILPYVAQAIGFDGSRLTKESAAIKSSMISKQTLHRAYGLAIVNNLR